MASHHNKCYKVPELPAEVHQAEQHPKQHGKMLKAIIVSTGKSSTTFDSAAATGCRLTGAVLENRKISVVYCFLLNSDAFVRHTFTTKSPQGTLHKRQVQTVFQFRLIHCNSFTIQFRPIPVPLQLIPTKFKIKNVCNSKSFKK